MTVVLVKPVRKEQRAQKASAIVLGTHNDRHSIASCYSPWVHRGTCLGPVLAREQLHCWDVDPLKIKGRGKNRKERVFSPIDRPHVVRCLPTAVAWRRKFLQEWLWEGRF